METKRVLIEDVKPTDLIVLQYEGESVSFYLTVNPYIVSRNTGSLIVSRLVWQQILYTDTTNAECMLFVESGDFVYIKIE
tara:strand:+ start:643 stop:882 length:240 start_codon:yes stop_codon:yes gene_type:complete